MHIFIYNQIGNNQNQCSCGARSESNRSKRSNFLLVPGKRILLDG